MPNNYLNLTESAEVIGISRMTIHRWVKKGKLRPIIIGDYPLLTPEQILPYVIKKRCLNCYHEKHKNGTQTCACRELCDMEDGCKDWAWKWN